MAAGTLWGLAPWLLPSPGLGSTQKRLRSFYPNPAVFQEPEECDLAEGTQQVGDELRWRLRALGS